MSVKLNVHTSVNLGYSFLSTDDSDLGFSSHLLRDALLNKKLKFKGLKRQKNQYIQKIQWGSIFDAKVSYYGIYDSPLYEY